MQLAKVMTVLAAARLAGEHDTLVWRIVNHYVDLARSKADHSHVTQAGMDETATVFAFAEDLKAHRSDP